MSRNEMNAVRALEALRVTVGLLGGPQHGTLEHGGTDDQMNRSLATLSGAVGASRACWCFIDSNRDDAFVDGYLTGGDPAVAPVGPSALGRSLRGIPELQPVLEHDSGFVVVATSDASNAFGAIVRESNADWVATAASDASGSGRSVLFLAGRGEPPDPEQLHLASLSAISEIMRATVRTPSLSASKPVDNGADSGFGEVVARLRSVLADLETFNGTIGLGFGYGILPEVFGELTARETEIVDCLLEGVRVTTIAQRLFLSPHTVRNHLRSIFRKVGVTSQAELIQLARGMQSP